MNKENWDRLRDTERDWWLSEEKGLEDWEKGEGIKEDELVVTK